MPRGPAQRETRGIVIGIRELERLREKFAHLEEALKQSPELADAIGEQQVASAKRRIRQTKKSPEGKPWKPWSQKYAKTRKRQHSLLIATGSLRDSITHNVLSPGEVEVGSNLDYARVHLMGSEDVPARPYLDTEGGFGDPHDRAEIREILRDFLRGELSKEP